jgi:hypothetical protein
MHAASHEIERECAVLDERSLRRILEDSDVIVMPDPRS